jgi:hypothetical protein
LNSGFGTFYITIAIGEQSSVAPEEEIKRYCGLICKKQTAGSFTVRTDLSIYAIEEEP